MLKANTIFIFCSAGDENDGDYYRMVVIFFRTKYFCYGYKYGKHKPIERTFSETL